VTPQAQKICTMLEAVNDDTAVEVLGEIDVLMALYVAENVTDDGRQIFVDRSLFAVYKTDTLDCELFRKKGSWLETSDLFICGNTDKQYTRSRDALKAVRDAELEGHMLTIITDCNRKTYATITIPAHSEGLGDYFEYFEAPKLHTETIAEAHAIIAAIDWKRQNDE